MNYEKKKTTILLILLITITISAICVTLWALFLRTPTMLLAPDYAPKEEDKHAEPLPDDSGEKLEQPEGGGAVSLIYSTKVSANLTTENVTLFFGNPQKSNQDILLQIIVKGQVIAQSGRIVPGKKISTLDLLKDGPQLSPGGYSDCKIMVFYYNAETGEKELLNTEIPISLSVTE